MPSTVHSRLVYRDSISGLLGGAKFGLVGHKVEPRELPSVVFHIVYRDRERDGQLNSKTPQGKPSDMAGQFLLK
jgi:hypothetical protein